jgi:hypothetical protein
MRKVADASVLRALGTPLLRLDAAVATTVCV